MAKTNGILEIKNRKASHEFEFLEEEIAGISLIGSEVKSIRAGKASIAEAYCYIQDGEVIITGMHIAEYKEAGRQGHDPYRKRKLLMTKKQIQKWDKKLETKGLTIVPVKLFINQKGFVKIKIALAKGKKQFDKRESIKKKDMQRDVDRALKG
ncbi:MAG: SsrA-binding protein SmpB [Nanoarchaeota archaeon]